MIIEDFGLGEYQEILIKQKNYFDALVTSKKKGEKGNEYILLGEHPAVITLGRRAKEENILYPEKYLKERGIQKFHIGRGGDVTFHGPGQLIVYPIIDLEARKLGVKEYVNLLEEAVIRLLRKFGIESDRIDGATGVWIDKATEQERKICAIGIKCSRFCTMHGIGLNVNTDLEGFSLINPCGFQTKGVTSIKKEMGRNVNLEEVKRDFLHIFLSLILPFEEVLNLPE